MDMNLLPIILYGVGIVGIILAIILMILALKQNTKSSIILILIVFFLSLVLLCVGTVLTLMRKSTSERTSETPVKVIEETYTKKSPSYEDLSFMYKLDSSNNLSKKSVSMQINNNSSSIFSGEVNLNFVNPSNQTTNSLVLPIKNLMPSSSYSPNALVNQDASDATYNFSGTFNENISDSSLPYTIQKVAVGNNFFRFDVVCDDISQVHLQSICNEFSNEYTKNLCDGFLIYFYSTEASIKDSNISNFQNAVADYYLNNVDNKSQFKVY